MMKQIKGFVVANLLPYLAMAAAAVIFSGFALYAAYEKGGDDTDAKWRLRQVALAQAASDAIMELKDDNRALEKARAVDAANITNLMRQGVKRHATKANTIINDVRAGTIKLRVPTIYAPTSCTDGGGGAGGIRLGNDGSRRAELSRQASEFFIGEAARADEIVEKLTACQTQLLADRRKQGRHASVVSEVR